MLVKGGGATATAGDCREGIMVLYGYTVGGATMDHLFYLLNCFSMRYKCPDSLTVNFLDFYMKVWQSKETSYTNSSHSEVLICNVSKLECIYM